MGLIGVVTVVPCLVDRDGRHDEGEEERAKAKRGDGRAAHARGDDDDQVALTDEMEGRCAGGNCGDDATVQATGRQGVVDGVVQAATALASKLASSGHNVAVGSRNHAATAQTWTDPTVRHADHAQAARDAAIIINATPGDTSLDRLTLLRAELDDKILVDVANATERGADGLPGGLRYPNSSLAEYLQHALPGAHVVKTLNTMLFTVMVDPHSLSTPPTAFLSGNDDDAKATVGGLLGALGWPAEWITDLGDITTARGPEALVLLVPHLFRATN